MQYTFREYVIDTMANAGFDRAKLNRLNDEVLRELYEAWDNDGNMEAVLNKEGLTLEFMVY